VGLRFSNIMEPQDYARFPGFWGDPHSRKWNLWGYVDARDVAQSCRRSLEAGIQGAEAFIIAAADTVMNRPSRELLAEVYPGVPLRDGVGEFDTLLGIDKARKLLGYAPGYSWREHVG
jgi:nucleoside-diphosphate-sugar epimerase